MICHHSDDAVCRDYVPHRPMMAHQRVFFDRFVDAEYGALFWEQRARKSKVVVDIWRHGVQTGRFTALVVIAYPAGVHRVWLDEIPWDVPPESWGRVRALAWDAGRVATAAYRERMAELLEHRPAVVLTLNCHALITDPCWRYLEKFFRVHRCLVAADESSWMANYCRRTRRALTLSRWTGAAARFLLDGTPADEGPLDLFFPTQFLRPGLLGESTAAGFRNRYAEWEEKINHRTNAQYKQLLGYRRMDELRGRLATFSTRVLRSQVSDAPPKTYQVRPFELSARQRAVYDRLDTEYSADLASGRIVAARDVLLRLTRLSMVARNYYPPERVGVPCRPCRGTGVLDDGDGCAPCEGLGVVVETTALERIDPESNPAAEALAYELRMGVGPAVIWARFVQDAEDAAAVAREARGRDAVVMYYGRQTTAQNEAAYLNFKRDGGPSVIVCTVQSGVTRGHDLSRASTLIYYSNSYSRRDRGQSEDRAENLDRRTSTDVVDLVALDTRDVDCVRALWAKRSIAAEVLGDPKFEIEDPL